MAAAEKKQGQLGSRAFCLSLKCATPRRVKAVTAQNPGLPAALDKPLFAVVLWLCVADGHVSSVDEASMAMSVCEALQGIPADVSTSPILSLSQASSALPCCATLMSRCISKCCLQEQAEAAWHLPAGKPMLQPGSSCWPPGTCLWPHSASPPAAGPPGAALPLPFSSCIILPDRLPLASRMHALQPVLHSSSLPSFSC